MAVTRPLTASDRAENLVSRSLSAVPSELSCVTSPSSCVMGNEAIARERLMRF